MRIVPVTEHHGLSEFIEVPWMIRRNDSTWVPPLREQVLFELSDRGAFARYGARQLFLCEADGTVAGRIAALTNPRLRDEAGNVLGQLGYFESVDDPAIAQALVDAGIEWLRGQGARQVTGPMDGGAHRPHRFLTRGFERDPHLFEPRNPAYYPMLFERCGFEVSSRWYGFDLRRPDVVDWLERFQRILDRRPAPGSVECLAAGRSPATLARLHRLLDDCWTGNVGYAPLDVEEFAEVFAGAQAIMSPGHLSVFVHDGRDAGLGYVFPDYASEVRALNGRAAGWGEWLGTANPTRIVLHTIALVPEVRHTSAALAQLAWAFKCAVVGGFEEAVVALVKDGWLNRMGEATREYALYTRRIS